MALIRTLTLSMQQIAKFKDGLDLFVCRITAAMHLMDQLRLKVPLKLAGTNEYNRRDLEAKKHIFFLYGRDLVADLVHEDHKHFRLGQLIGSASMMQYLIGFNTWEFGKVFQKMLPAMQCQFNKSTIIHREGKFVTRPKVTSLRFKLFLALMWLRRCYTYRELEALSGWDHSTIGNFVWVTVLLMHRELVPEYLAFPTKERQVELCDAFETEDLKQPIIPSNLWSFTEVRYSPALRILGTPDGTFSVRTKPEDKIEQEVMYTGYKKYHAYKLNVVSSPVSSEIIQVSIHTATIGDVRAFKAATLPLLAKGVQVAGDKAYHSVEKCITYFKESEYSRVRAFHKAHPKRGLHRLIAAMRTFDKALQKYRIVVEQAIGALKEWGFVRGSSVHNLKRGGEDIKIGIELCAALTNLRFRVHNCVE